MGFESSSELFINMNKRDIPPYNPDKSYFDQSVDVIQFYENELRKIREGVNIGGYKVHPWMYFHMNFFKNLTPISKNQSKVTTIPLDDNFIYIVESYQEAEEEGLGVLLYGSRGFAKTTSIASLEYWSAVSHPGETTLVLGGSEDDLAGIGKVMEIMMNYSDPFIQLPTISKNWLDEVVFGYKEDRGTNMIQGYIDIRNLSGGTDKKSEKGAGANPRAYIVDEVGKFNFLKAHNAALASFRSQYGMKLVPFLCGTAGNRELSKDAEKVLSNPRQYKMLPVNWDRLDRTTDDMFRTWKDSKKTSFSTFVPAQMSYRAEVLKLDSTLGKFLKKRNPELDKIKIKVTDWKAADEWIEKEIESITDITEKNRQKAYYCRKPEDVFMDIQKNRFPVHLIRRRIAKLKEEGITGRPVEIFKNGDKWMTTFSDKKRADIKYQGGAVEAPFMIYGDFPTKPADKYSLAAGLDDYKQAQSSTDSLGALYGLTRPNLKPNDPFPRITFSYVARPQRHEDFHINIETVLTAYGAECLIEAADEGIVKHLGKKAPLMLTPAINFSPNSQGRTPNHDFGLWPTPFNIGFRLDLVINMWSSKVDIGVDAQGGVISIYGVDSVDDIDLLEESLEWTPTGNFDRIAAYSHALALIHYWDMYDLKPNTWGANKFRLFDPETERPVNFNQQRIPYTSRSTGYNKKYR